MMLIYKSIPFWKENCKYKTQTLLIKVSEVYIMNGPQGKTKILPLRSLKAELIGTHPC